jgi:hypothetical protein
MEVGVHATAESESGHRHRLAAILAADVVGYSRLMALDESATVVALDTARSMFRIQIESRRGRVIDILSLESSDLPRPAVSEHRTQAREGLQHSGDDRDFARTARGHEAVKDRPDHWVVLDGRDRGHVQAATGFRDPEEDRLPPTFTHPSVVRGFL